METVKNAANYVVESVQSAGATTSKEVNKEVAKDSDAKLSTRANAAVDALGDKKDEVTHDTKADVYKGRTSPWHKRKRDDQPQYRILSKDVRSYLQNGLGVVRTIAKDWQDEIESRWPRYYDEMKGISDGAETALIDILILNIRTEIAFGMFNDGCTSLYWEMKGNTFLAQNWDWMEEQKQNLIILDIASDKIPRIKMVTEAGIIGKIGLNKLGVGVYLNAIKIPGCDTTRMPVHLALRLVLESSSADHAVQQLEKVGLAASAHLLIGDKEKAVGLESTAKTIMLITEDERGQVFHANNLLLQHEGSVDAVWLADSPCRQRRIQELATRYHTSNDREPGIRDVTCLLDDHDGFPYSICRYEEGPLGMDATIFSIVMDLRDIKTTVYLGRPCQPEETLSLKF